ncbi:MAG TPA: class II fructose-1,6-bisphosphate aldolase [Firmicutes bacterium]|nr:class II fructose-1,6-bisphosphate aldolase [Bacillota bacterium]
MLVTGKQILDDANKNGYAVGAFNVVNMEMLQAVVTAAEEEKSPVFVQTTEGALSYAGYEYLSAMVTYAANSVSVPVAFHLDHGGSYKTVMNCLRNGWSSVMIDGSHLSLEDNIALTAKVVESAHDVGVSVEAELGRLGGIEDNIKVDEKDAMYTDPEEAKRFVAETGVDYLAIAIGTAHGKYKGVPKLDFDRLDTIKKDLNMPIVLHGASGVSDESIKKAVSLGINKINIDTELRCAYTDKVREIFAADPELFDLRKYIGPARENVKAKVIEKIRLFGSNGKA